MSGADAGLGDGWRLGFATGYTQTNIDVAGRLSSAEIDSYHFGRLCRRPPRRACRARRRGVGHGAASTPTRTVLFSGFFDRTKASYDGDTGQLFGEVSLPLLSHKTAVEPFAGLAYVHVDTDGFTEKGGAAALAGSGSDVSTGFATLGAARCDRALR